MIKIFTVFILIFIFSACSEQHISQEVKSSIWNQGKRSAHLNNRSDTSTWDLEMFEDDKQLIGIGDLGPFEIGIYPVTKYETLGQGSFNGLRTINEAFSINKKNVLMSSFFVKSNTLNKNKLGDASDDLFFQILVLSDTLDNQNYNLNKNITLSRNHPDYLGQGFVQTKNNRIDYLAFTTAEENAYAIVNGRIFDLTYGQTILIAPQKDMTLRSFQIRSTPMTSDSILNYTSQLITKKNIIAFFDNDQNI